MNPPYEFSVYYDKLTLEDINNVVALVDRNFKFNYPGTRISVTFNSTFSSVGISVHSTRQVAEIIKENILSRHKGCTLRKDVHESKRTF